MVLFSFKMTIHRRDNKILSIFPSILLHLSHLFFHLLSPPMHAVGISTHIVQPHLVIGPPGLCLEEHGHSILLKHSTQSPHFLPFYHIYPIHIPFHLLSPPMHAVGIGTHIVQPHLVIGPPGLCLEEHGLPRLAARAVVVPCARQRRVRDDFRVDVP